MAVQNPTTNYAWALPTVGASIGVWGTLLNALLGDDVAGVDAVVKAVSVVANAAMPKAGGSFTGAVTALANVDINGSGELLVNGVSVLTQARVLQNVTADAAIITSGVLAGARIPFLDASWITTGAFADARIPALAASKITSGTFANALIAQGNVTQHQAALAIAASQVAGGAPTFSGAVTASTFYKSA
jgi:hypothetical protein